MRKKSGDPSQEAKPTPRQKREVCEFYYGEDRPRYCFVCAKEVSNPEYHHVNEKKTWRHTRFENLVPICRTCNENIELSKPNYRHSEIDQNVQPGNILVRAQHWSAGRKYTAALVCSRIAAHLFSTRRNDCEGQLRCLAYAVGSLRPSSDLRLVKHIIGEAKKAFRLAGSSASPFCRAEFLSQLGLLLCDFGMFPIGYECTEYAYRVVKKIGQTALMGLPSRLDLEMLLGDHARRVAFAMTPIQQVPPKFASEIHGHLIKDLDVFKQSRYRGYATNLDVLAYRERECKAGVGARLRDLAERAFEQETKIENDWVKASHHANRGLCLVRDGGVRNRKKGVDELIAACRIYHSGRICPEPNISGTRYPNQVLKDLGYNDVPLITRRGVFPLSSSKLRDVLNVIMGYKP